MLAWFLDPAIEFPNPTETTNLEPLLINTAGSWHDRPSATRGSPTSCWPPTTCAPTRTCDHGKQPTRPLDVR